MTAAATSSAPQKKAQVATNLVATQQQQHNQKQQDASALVAQHRAAVADSATAPVPAEVVDNLIKSQKAISDSSEQRRQSSRGKPSKMGTLGLNRPASALLYHN